jgi:hypothetical protein
LLDYYYSDEDAEAEADELWVAPFAVSVRHSEELRYGH